MNQKLPVHFIVGPHRSGTTFLHSLIGCMPNVAVGFETHFYCRIQPYLEELKTTSNSVEFSNLKTAVTKIMLHNNEINLDWSLIRDAFNCNNRGILFSTILQSCSKSILGNPLVWVEKTPSHLMFLDNIREDFENSKFIIIYRDPRYILTSFLKYTRHLSEPLKLGFLQKECKYINRCFDKIIEYQRRNINNIFVIRYEQLILDPFVSLKEICQFLGITYKKPTIELYNKAANSIILNSEHHKINSRSFYQKNNRTWEDDLSFKERYFIELLLSDNMNVFGYRKKYRFLQLSKKVNRKFLEHVRSQLTAIDDLGVIFNKIPQNGVLEKYIPYQV